ARGQPENPSMPEGSGKGLPFQARGRQIPIHREPIPLAPALIGIVPELRVREAAGLLRQVAHDGKIRREGRLGGKGYGLGKVGSVQSETGMRPKIVSPLMLVEAVIIGGARLPPQAVEGVPEIVGSARLAGHDSDWLV